MVKSSGHSLLIEICNFTARYHENPKAILVHPNYMQNLRAEREELLGSFEEQPLEKFMDIPLVPTIAVASYYLVKDYE